MARLLIQLEDLQVVECGQEEIVELEDGVEAAARLVFPKVTLLMLKNLPKLKWFSRGLRALEWPLLKVLEVIDCDQTEIISSKILNIHETVEQSQLETFSSKQPLFLVEELAEAHKFYSESYPFKFPSLEEVIVWQCLKMKDFCPGMFKTPKLERVPSTKEYEWRWKAALNANTSALEERTIKPPRDCLVQKGLVY
uniref:Disease resistance protein n=1 Tax=Quercus lobata TaxID=97700 RepID=A0A7N2L3P2_QUELO